MTKTIKINELVSELKEYDGELPVKVWNDGADKAYPISYVGQVYTDRVLDTYVSIVVDDDRNLVDLSKIWHDASEMPKNHSYIMFMFDRYTIETDYIPACLNHCQLNSDNWNEFVKNNRITKWAYISDLLPKGGEK